MVVALRRFNVEILPALYSVQRITVAFERF